MSYSLVIIRSESKRLPRFQVDLRTPYYVWDLNYKCKWTTCFLYAHEIRFKVNDDRVVTTFLRAEIPLDLKAFRSLSAFMLWRHARMWFYTLKKKNNQMNKQSAIMSTVPEPHLEYKSRDWLLDALHRGIWQEISIAIHCFLLDLVKQTRGSAFFIDSTSGDGQIDFFPKCTLRCSWGI